MVVSSRRVIAAPDARVPPAAQDPIRRAEAHARAQRINNPQRARLLGLKAAAQHLGVTEWQMRTLVWNGVIPVVQFPNGRKKYFDTADLDELIQRNKVTSN